VEFLSRTNWLFRLERTADFTEWTPVTAAVVGAGGAMQLRDFNPPAVSGFYRVRAYRE
jgi:hypothetical protein